MDAKDVLISENSAGTFTPDPPQSTPDVGNYHLMDIESTLKNRKRKNMESNVKMSSTKVAR